MEYLYGLEQYQNKQETVVTIGKFDGFHRGHQTLLKRVQQESAYKSVVLAFDMTPLYLERGKPILQLLTKEERADFLCGQVNIYLECPFTKEFRQLSGEDFIKKVLVERLHAKVIVVGEDFTFGYRAKGTPELLERLQEQYGYRLFTEKKIFHGEREISSTYIRECIRGGKVKLAGELLGRPYEISGEVQRGRGIGAKTFQIPTANLILPAGKLLPPYGVYVVQVWRGEKSCFGIGNLGRKPTIAGEDEAGLEVHLFECQENLYGERLRVQLLTFLREECKFPSVGELKRQMKRDIEKARRELWEFR